MKSRKDEKAVAIKKWRGEGGEAGEGRQVQSAGSKKVGRGQGRFERGVPSPYPLI